MAPAMTVNVQIGKPKTAVRWATRSRTAAPGSRDSRLPGSSPAATRSECRTWTRYRTLAIPLTKKMPKPMIAVVTWMASQ